MASPSLSGRALPPALTVRQPHAGRIASGVKRHELRSWVTPYRGPVLVHAGAATEAGADEGAVRSAFVAVVWLAGAQPWRELSPFAEAEARRWASPDRYGVDRCRVWVFTASVALDEPIAYVAGRLGLWAPTWLSRTHTRHVLGAVQRLERIVGVRIPDDDRPDPVRGRRRAVAR